MMFLVTSSSTARDRQFHVRLELANRVGQADGETSLECHTVTPVEDHGRSEQEDPGAPRTDGDRVPLQAFLSAGAEVPVGRTVGHAYLVLHGVDHGLGHITRVDPVTRDDEEVLPVDVASVEPLLNAADGVGAVSDSDIGVHVQQTLEHLRHEIAPPVDLVHTHALLQRRNRRSDPVTELAVDAAAVVALAVQGRLNDAYEVCRRRRGSVDNRMLSPQSGQCSGSEAVGQGSDPQLPLQGASEGIHHIPAGLPVLLDGHACCGCHKSR